MQLLRLREQGVTAGVTLEPREVAWLRDCNAGITVFATGEQARFDVRASERVGVIVGPAGVVIIEPKTPMANLLFLLGDGAGFELGPTAHLAADATLVDAMGQLYAATLERSLRTGALVAQYVEQWEETPVPRGRIDWLSVQTRRFGLFPPVASIATDLVLDTELNRRLLSALVAMHRFAVSVSVRDRINALVPRFTGVTCRRYAATTLPTVVLDRRTQRFAGSLRLAEAILRGLAASLNEGDTSSPSFVIDMNDVFERFVIRALGESVAPYGFVLRHHPEGLFLDAARQVRIIPDGVLYSPRLRPLAVIDAKYKLSSSGESQDVYQALAYCIAVGVPRGAIVYVGNADCEHVVERTGTRVHVVGLDLSQEPNRIRTRIMDLARRLIAPSSRDA